MSSGAAGSEPSEEKDDDDDDSSEGSPKEKERKGRAVQAQGSPAVRVGWLRDGPARDGRPRNTPPSAVVPGLAPTAIAVAARCDGGGRSSESRPGLVPGWWVSWLCCQQ